MRFKLTLEYDGSNYAGWQKQKNSQTIQGALINAFEQVLQAENGRLIDLQGAGRTDAGVHAYGQVAHIECQTTQAPAELLEQVNAQLPPAIGILSLEPTPERFHARHWASSRQYLYRISTRRNVFEKKYCCWVKEPLAIERMQAALPLVLGHHDFASFSSKPQKEKSTEVVVEWVELSQQDGMLLLRIKASHFLWNMVRNWVGVLLEIGKGNLPAAYISNALENYDPDFCRYRAPAAGLFLEKVEYLPRP